jgi:hypothetical protein
VAQRNDHANRVLDLASKEADLLGHRYLGPEHLVLGVLRDGGSEASRVCWKPMGSTWQPRGKRWAGWSTATWCPVRARATPSCWALWALTWT